MSTIAEPASESIGARFSRSLAAVGLVLGIYVHFLLFAQFGFLQGLRAAGAAPELIHQVLGSMALAGIAAGFAAAAIVRRHAAAPTAGLAFGAAAAASVVAALAFSSPHAATAVFHLSAVLTGIGLGGATVCAADLLRSWTGGRGLGLHVGLGTGAAYLACNIPALFAATPAAKSWISAAAAVVGIGAVVLGRRSRASYVGSTYTRLGSSTSVALATAAFLALVWFDSTVFGVLQNSEVLRAAHWSDPTTLGLAGLTHAAAAVAAGLLIDRGALRAVLGIAFVLLAAGHLGFEREAGAWATLAYAGGVSLYSTALAAFAAIGPPNRGVPPAHRAAWIYAVAGWIGSAGGVGLAEQSGRVPSWAMPAAAIVLGLSLARLPLR